MQLGNPSSASADTNNHDHFLLQRSVEAIDFNDNRGLPNWASWNLTAADIGTNSRTTFITDTNLPPNFYRVAPGDYSGSGYDRGHLSPSKDRSASAAINDAVYFMSNVLPQNSLNNSGVWLQFENYCRDLVESTNNYELLITCGPSGFGSARINTNGPVFIPDYVWKVVVVVPPGAGFATNRITATNRVIAIKIPNNDSATNSWPAYVTSANQIQVDTGLTFFTSLPADVAAALRSRVDGQTNPPPAIYSFAPTIGAPGTNVIITGTNFNAASAVTFNGANASFTIDTPTQITATVPTNAGTGFISVTTPSGTAITNTFTVLNNGGIVYNGILAAWDVSTLPGGLNNYGPSPFAPTTNGPNLAVVGLTRGTGVRTSGTAGASGWGGTAFTNLTAAAAIGSNQFASFTVTASNGCTVSFTSLSRFDYYRSPTGPTNGLLQFQIGAGGFTDITNCPYSIASAGASIGPIDLSGISALQNVGANTNVTFRIVNYGGTSASGTWYIYDTSGSTAPDLVLQGTVTQLSPGTPPKLTIALISNNVALTWPITAATYTLQQNPDLNPAHWTTYGGSITSSGTNYTTTITQPTTNRFFRLSNP